MSPISGWAVGDRALVTGGAGFIGYHLACRLLEDGWEVVLVDDLSRGRLDPAVRALLDDVRFIEADLRRPLPVDQLGTGFRVVFHLAAIVGVARTVGDPARTLRTNLSVTLNVLDWCAAAGPEVVFLSSTSEVGDGAVSTGLSELPVAESVPAVFCKPFRPRSAYAVSKLASELLVAHCAAGAGYRARIARYHNVYGPRMGHDHVIPELINRIVAGQDPLVVYGATQTRAFCHVTDAVEATLRLAVHPASEPLVVNVGNDHEETRILELARQLADLLDVAVDMEPRVAPAGSPDRRLPDLTALRELTGCEPDVALADGLPGCIRWYAPRSRAS